MNQYEIAFDCVNGKSYKLKFNAETEEAAMNMVFNKDVWIVKSNNVIQAIKTKNIVFCEVLIKGENNEKDN